MDCFEELINQYLLIYTEENKEKLKEVQELGRELVVSPYTLNIEDRYLVLRVIRSDLLTIFKRITNKLSEKLSRKIKEKNKVVLISCSETHIERVTKMVDDLFNKILTCKCGEKDTFYDSQTFSCKACGTILSTSLKFKRI